MNIDFFSFDGMPPSGDHPIEPVATRPSRYALRYRARAARAIRHHALATRLNRYGCRCALPVGRAEMRLSARCVVAPRRLLQPAGRSHATSLACFQPSNMAQAGLEPSLSLCPDAPPAARSGAPNSRHPGA
ncbi:MAG TPA: hypothetical protein PLB25_07665 [Rhodoferax sp.]|nr:hypothetical protein [Rhodoferax sp.]